MTKSPLLLLDNSTMMSVINRGSYKCTDLSFEEAKSIIEMYDVEQILRCFYNTNIENIIYNYLGIESRSFKYKSIRNMRVNQDGIVFKLYITPSETQPIIITEQGTEAKKIQNVYVYCQLISRLE